MPGRVIAIGDIHGCSAALDSLIAAILPRSDDTIITLGDYINRGPDTRGVIERLIDLARRCRLVPILGNHDRMFLEARSGLHPTTWLGMGGVATLDSYGLAWIIHGLLGERNAGNLQSHHPLGRAGRSHFPVP